MGVWALEVVSYDPDYDTGTWKKKQTVAQAQSAKLRGKASEDQLKMETDLFRAQIRQHFKRPYYHKPIWAYGSMGR